MSVEVGSYWVLDGVYGNGTSCYARIESIHDTVPTVFRMKVLEHDNRTDNLESVLLDTDRPATESEILHAKLLGL